MGTLVQMQLHSAPANLCVVRTLFTHLPLSIVLGSSLPTKVYKYYSSLFFASKQIASLKDRYRLRSVSLEERFA
jgi:hypothetical protein